MSVGIWPEGNQFATFGQAGDYIGGIWGTVIAAITLIVVFFTWKSTQKSNSINGVGAILSEMLKTHDTISSIGTGFWSRDGSPSLILREFYSIYRITKRVEPDFERWSIRDRIDISYTFVFFGLSSQSRNSLARYDDNKLKIVQDEVNKLKNKNLEKFGQLFKGHQATISHYQRNLFGMYTFLDSSKIPEEDKVSFAKIIRTKLSNYDQAVLALNVISHLGAEWERTGLMERYKPIANIPQHFFNFDDRFDIKWFFPSVIFEWENRNDKRPTYRHFSFKRWRVLVETLPADV